MPTDLCALTIGGAVAAGLFFVMFLIGAPLVPFCVTVVGSLLATGGTCYWFFKDLPGENDESRGPARRAAYAAAQAMAETLRQERAEACKVANVALRVRNGLKAAANAPTNRLLGVNYHAMTGDQFEYFLGDVFRNLGYRVHPTGKSGDQGVDLVVERDGVRIAVQAKCYSGTVGNAAVQQAYAGCTFYKCHRCAVVTNNEFTASARELAASVGCRLVGGGQLRDLIRGRITI